MLTHVIQCHPVIVTIRRKISLDYTNEWLRTLLQIYNSNYLNFNLQTAHEWIQASALENQYQLLFSSTFLKSLAPTEPSQSLREEIFMNIEALTVTGALKNSWFPDRIAFLFSSANIVKPVYFMFNSYLVSKWTKKINFWRVLLNLQLN